jgi:GNAT superfamily N-acetyltransferase
MQNENDLRDLFATHRQLRGGLEMVLSGRCGEIRSSKISAVAVADPFVYVAGEPDPQLASDLKAGQIVIGPPNNWIPLLTTLFPSSTSVARQFYDARDLDPSHLAGFMAGFDIRRVDSELAPRLAREVHDDLVLFPEPFDVDGVGFCALSEGKLVAGATGALWSETEVEIQVNTAAAYRGKGFAGAVSAALITECLSRGITPNWETEDVTSARLAERLGYVKIGTYEWLVLE